MIAGWFTPSVFQTVFDLPWARNKSANVETPGVFSCNYSAGSVHHRAQIAVRFHSVDFLIRCYTVSSRFRSF